MALTPCPVPRPPPCPHPGARGFLLRGPGLRGEGPGAPGPHAPGLLCPSSFLIPCRGVLWLKRARSWERGTVAVPGGPGPGCSSSGPWAEALSLGPQWQPGGRSRGGASAGIACSPRGPREPVDGSRGQGSSVRSPGSGGRRGVPDAQAFPSAPRGLGLGAWRSPSPSLLCWGAGVPTPRGPRTSEAWSCPRVAVGALGWGMSQPARASGWSWRPGGHS